MKYSIRSLLVLVILVAVGLRIKSYCDYLEWRSFIPVSYQLEPYWETKGPPRIHVKFGPNAVAELESRKGSIKETPPDISEVLNRPEAFSHYQGTSLKKEFPDWQKLPSMIVPKLNDQSLDLEQRLRLAGIAASLASRDAFDWILKTFHESDTNQDVLIALNQAAPEFLSEIDLWKLIRTQLDIQNTYPNHPLFRLASKHCHEEAWQLLEQMFVDGDVLPENLASVARELGSTRPTLRSLQASAFLFPAQRPPGFDWNDAHDSIYMLKSYLHEDDPEIRKLALVYAKRMSNSSHWASRAFMEVIVEHANSSWEPFFREKCKKKRWRQSAFDGLVASWDESERTANLWDLIEDESDFASKQLETMAIHKLIRRLEGTKDAKLTNHLQVWFQDSKSQYAVEALYRLGHRPVEMQKQVYDDLANGHNLHKLLSLLQQNGLAAGVTEKQVNQEAMDYHSYCHTDFITNKDQIDAALELAGLRHNIYCIQSVDEHLAQFAEMSRGKIQLETIFLNHARSQLEFEFSDRVFQIDMEDSDDYFDVYKLSEILNAILERDGIEERFLPYYSDHKESYFFFGSPLLAKSLQDDFKIEFQKATNEFLDGLTESAEHANEK